jgi:hypothetical protein
VDFEKSNWTFSKIISQEKTTFLMKKSAKFSETWLKIGGKMHLPHRSTKPGKFKILTKLR